MYRKDIPEFQCSPCSAARFAAARQATFNGDLMDDRRRRLQHSAFRGGVSSRFDL